MASWPSVDKRWLFAGGSSCTSCAALLSSGDHLALVDIGLALRKSGDARRRHAEVARQRRRIDAAQPVADPEGAALGIEAITEREQRMAGLVAQGEDGVCMALRKVPQVARTVVGDIQFAVGIAPRSPGTDPPGYKPTLPAVECQCISREPPGFMNRWAPAISVASGRWRALTSRAHPPDVAFTGFRSSANVNAADCRVCAALSA